MKEIPLTRGLAALVDDEDFERLMRYKWHAVKGTCTFYAARQVRQKGVKNKVFYMHRFIMIPGENTEVDHRDCNGLNNQRSNLRLATSSQNHHNARRSKNNTSGFKGVHISRNKFRAGIYLNGIRKHLGVFDTAEAAYAAYCKAAVELHREFARFA